MTAVLHVWLMLNPLLFNAQQCCVSLSFKIPIEIQKVDRMTDLQLEVQRFKDSSRAVRTFPMLKQWSKHADKTEKVI